MAHTPGPWKVDKSGFNVIRSTAPITIAMTQPSTHMKANARLIAAAPELLEALKTLDNIERGMQGWHEDAKANVWARARAAIAKAEGRS